MEDWHFKDVLSFFKSSVTNEKACIKTISEREVDGALIASMNDKEMEAGMFLIPHRSLWPNVSPYQCTSLEALIFTFVSSIH